MSVSLCAVQQSSDKTLIGWVLVVSLEGYLCEEDQMVSAQSQTVTFLHFFLCQKLEATFSDLHFEKQAELLGIKLGTCELNSLRLAVRILNLKMEVPILSSGNLNLKVQVFQHYPGSCRDGCAFVSALVKFNLTGKL